MSYHTHMTGRIAITPPLCWEDIKITRRFMPSGDGSGETDLVFEIVDKYEDTPAGELHIITAVALVPADHERTTTSRPRTN